MKVFYTTQQISGLKANQRRILYSVGQEDRRWKSVCRRLHFAAQTADIWNSMLARNMCQIKLNDEPTDGAWQHATRQLKLEAAS